MEQSDGEGEVCDIFDSGADNATKARATDFLLPYSLC